MQLQQDRVREIQNALAKEGYYQGEPSGKWDETTKDAMRRYQTSNGFEPTGLPDAKSLMKLGLGPHPLAPELDPAARAGATSQLERPNIAPRSALNDKSGQPNIPNEP